MSTLFIWRHGGYLIGSLLSGPVVDRFNEYFLIGLSFVLMAICVAISPWWPKIAVFSVMYAIGGLANCICVMCEYFFKLLSHVPLYAKLIAIT